MHRPTTVFSPRAKHMSPLGILAGSAALCVALVYSPNVSAEEAIYTVNVGEQARFISVETVEGVHVNLKAPMDLVVDGLDPLKAMEDKKGHGGVNWSLSNPLEAGELVNLNFSLCDDKETWCRIMQVAFNYDSASVEQQTQKAMPPKSDDAAHAALMPGHVSYAIQGDLPGAFEKAASSDSLVLIDFGAVWCPPCQLLNAEGFADATITQTLSDVVVVQLDADHPSSWDGKSRYKVGGYPTMVLTKANGDEISRMVGYPGLEGMQHWLDSNIESGRPASEWMDMRASGDRSPEVLLGVARHLTNLDLEEEAANLYREALSNLRGSDELEARYAVLVDAASRGNAREVKTQFKALTNIDNLPLDTLWIVYSAAASASAAKHEKLADKLSADGLKLSQDISESAPEGSERKADAIEAIATFLEAMERPVEAKQAYSDAADAWIAVLEQQESQDGNRFMAFRAQARALTGDLRRAERFDEAEAFHKELTTAFPEEMTYHYDYARFLKAQERMDEARESAESAVKFAYGDNLYWSTGLLADIMNSQGETETAIALLKETIDGAELPDDPTIRTHRYVQRLEKQIKTLQGDEESS